MNEPTKHSESPPRRKLRPRGSGTLFLRGNTWWIGYSVRGRTFNESSHSRKKTDAKTLLERRLNERASGEFVPPQKEKILLEQLAEGLFTEYENNGRRSIRDVRRNWELHLAKFFRGWRAIDVSADAVTRYIALRRTERARNATINRELAALNRMFTLAKQQGKVRDIPMIKKLRENNARKGFLADGAHLKIVEFCPELWFRTLVEIGRSYGWRINEVLSLKVKQIDLFSRTIRLEVNTTKTDDGREVAMTNAVYVLLSECIHNKAPEDAVLTRPNGKPVKDIRNVWYRACVHAGLATLHCPTCMSAVDEALHCAACGVNWQLNRLRYRGLLFHDLRRTGARNLRRAGVAEEVIMKIGGWKTSSVFKRYSIVGSDDIRDAMTKMQEREQLVEAERVRLLQLNYNSPETASVAVKAQIN